MVVSELVRKNTTIRCEVLMKVVKDQRVRIVGRGLGFVWVFAWFFWVTPRWVYAKTLCWSLRQALLRSGA
ncbi:uncharacterized protein GGS25DRAFT_499221 [Hypoxylon fragiforme]|uniref:uncharacterized protein n=1 Tax=Hypoxylon fragiforme TaxID=63214 RepID=UPI0020C5FE05|nr:uncharacterized protein GGS25DRAFT_499221 [Hypoxylon fragiforme]KAI2606028.1 hypothetical protein GGS25DRAFT_499221 [Hypoxylon fragiforme]